MNNSNSDANSNDARKGKSSDRRIEDHPTRPLYDRHGGISSSPNPAAPNRPRLRTR